MTLNDFKNHIESFPHGKVFKYGISDPFSWRGQYDCVAFSVIDKHTTREDILKEIEKAYTNVFYGYKGGSYTYYDYTEVYFEEYGSRNYSDGKYVAEKIAEIENSKLYSDQEHRLVGIAFK